MKPIFTIGAPHMEAVERIKQSNEYKELIKDYHVIVHSSQGADPQFKLHQVDGMSKHKINAKKYGRI